MKYFCSSYTSTPVIFATVIHSWLTLPTIYSDLQRTEEHEMKYNRHSCYSRGRVTLPSGGASISSSKPFRRVIILTWNKRKTSLVIYIFVMSILTCNSHYLHNIKYMYLWLRWRALYYPVGDDIVWSTRCHTSEVRAIHSDFSENLDQSSSMSDTPLNIAHV